MTFVSVTGVRNRLNRFMPGFALYAIRSFRQVEMAPGFVGGQVLPDRRWTFWTMTVRDGQARMALYMTTGSYRSVMPGQLQ